MNEIASFLATKGRTRFIAGDNPPSEVRDQLDVLVGNHRRALGFPVAGFRPTAADYNKALDWDQYRAISVDDLAALDWPDDDV